MRIHHIAYGKAYVKESNAVLKGLDHGVTRHTDGIEKEFEKIVKRNILQIEGLQSVNWLELGRSGFDGGIVLRRVETSSNEYMLVARFAGYKEKVATGRSFLNTNCYLFKSEDWKPEYLLQCVDVFDAEPAWIAGDQALPIITPKIEFPPREPLFREASEDTIARMLDGELAVRYQVPEDAVLLLERIVVAMCYAPRALWSSYSCIFGLTKEQSFHRINVLCDAQSLGHTRVRTNNLEAAQAGVTPLSLRYAHLVTEIVGVSEPVSQISDRLYQKVPGLRTLDALLEGAEQSLDDSLLEQYCEVLAEPKAYRDFNRWLKGKGALPTDMRFPTMKSTVLNQFIQCADIEAYQIIDRVVSSTWSDAWNGLDEGRSDAESLTLAWLAGIRRRPPQRLAFAKSLWLPDHSRVAKSVARAFKAKIDSEDQAALLRLIAAQNAINRDWIRGYLKEVSDDLARLAISRFIRRQTFQNLDALGALNVKQRAAYDYVCGNVTTKRSRDMALGWICDTTPSIATCLADSCQDTLNHCDRFHVVNKLWELTQDNAMIAEHFSRSAEARRNAQNLAHEVSKGQGELCLVSAFTVACNYHALQWGELDHIRVSVALREAIGQPLNAVLTASHQGLGSQNLAPSGVRALVNQSAVDNLLEYSRSDEALKAVWFTTTIGQCTTLAVELYAETVAQALDAKQRLRSEGVVRQCVGIVTRQVDSLDKVAPRELELIAAILERVVGDKQALVSYFANAASTILAKFLVERYDFTEIRVPKRLIAVVLNSCFLDEKQRSDWRLRSEKWLLSTEVGWRLLRSEPTSISSMEGDVLVALPPRATAHYLKRVSNPSLNLLGTLNVQQLRTLLADMDVLQRLLRLNYRGGGAVASNLLAAAKGRVDQIEIARNGDLLWRLLQSLNLEARRLKKLIKRIEKQANAKG